MICIFANFDDCVIVLLERPQTEECSLWNRACHPGGHYWNYYPGDPSQVKLPQLIWRSGNRSQNELQRLDYTTGSKDSSPSNGFQGTYAPLDMLVYIALLYVVIYVHCGCIRRCIYIYKPWGFLMSKHMTVIVTSNVLQENWPHSNCAKISGCPVHILTLHTVDWMWYLGLLLSTWLISLI